MRPFRVPHILQNPDLRQNFEELEDCLLSDPVKGLPTNPTDGEVVNFLADAANGVVWQLRYRAASTSTHKWEFIGGSEIVGQVAEQRGGRVIAAGEVNTWISLGGPKLTIPLAGDYDVRSESSLWFNTVGATLFQGINSVIADTQQVAVAGSWFVSNSSIRAGGISPTTWEQQYQSASTGTLFVSGSRIAARPVRVG